MGDQAERFQLPGRDQVACTIHAFARPARNEVDRELAIPQRLQGQEVIRAVAAMNAVISLTPGSMGPVLACDLVKTGEIIPLSRDIICPFYRKKVEQAVAQLLKELGDLDFYIHKPEGAFFLWLWFKGLPITSQELYERLKKRGVLVVPGSYFFPRRRRRSISSPERLPSTRWPMNWRA